MFAHLKSVMAFVMALSLSACGQENAHQTHSVLLEPVKALFDWSASIDRVPGIVFHQQNFAVDVKAAATPQILTFKLKHPQPLREFLIENTTIVANFLDFCAVQPTAIRVDSKTFIPAVPGNSSIWMAEDGQPVLDAGTIEITLAPTPGSTLVEQTCLISLQGPNQGQVGKLDGNWETSADMLPGFTIVNEVISGKGTVDFTLDPRQHLKEIAVSLSNEDLKVHGVSVSPSKPATGLALTERVIDVAFDSIFAEANLTGEMEFLSVSISGGDPTGTLTVVSANQGPLKQAPPDPVDPPGGACGGFAGLECAGENEFCFFTSEDFCGFADALGVCHNRPDVCPAVFDPVCGCDGNSYSNGCVANSAGVSVIADGPCASEELRFDTRTDRRASEPATLADAIASFERGRDMRSEKRAQPIRTRFDERLTKFRGEAERKRRTER